MPIYKTEEKKDGKQQYVVKVNYTDKNGNHKQIKRTTYGNAEAKLLEKQLLDETKLDIDTSIIIYLYFLIYQFPYWREYLLIHRM